MSTRSSKGLKIRWGPSRSSLKTLKSNCLPQCSMARPLNTVRTRGLTGWFNRSAITSSSSTETWTLIWSPSWVPPPMTCRGRTKWMKRGLSSSLKMLRRRSNHSKSSSKNMTTQRPSKPKMFGSKNLRSLQLRKSNYKTRSRSSTPSRSKRRWCFKRRPKG